MSRKPSVASTTTIELLKSFVQKKANFGTCTFSDVQQLQFKIKKEIDEYLSIQTLNRFFGLIKNDFKPAASTLNILARYVDYTSFAEFEIFTTKQTTVNNAPSFSSSIIMSLFSGVDGGGLQEKGLLGVVKNICRLLEKDPQLAKDMYPFMATTPFGRHYFFEQHINIDALNSHYGDGLSYYIMHTKEREQIFFAYTLLCMRYLLTCQYHLFSLYYTKLQDYKLEEVAHYSPHLIGRYFAVRVYHSIILEEVPTVLDEAVRRFATLRIPGVPMFPIAEYVFGEALVLAGEYHMAWEILQSARIYLNGLETETDKEFVTQYEIMQLFAGYAAGIISDRKALEEFKRLKEAPLYFLSEDFFAVIMHTLEQRLMPEMQRRSATQLDEVIRKTGFIFFKEGWNKAPQNDLLLMDIKGKKIG